MLVAVLCFGEVLTVYYVDCCSDAANEHGFNGMSVVIVARFDEIFPWDGVSD